MVSSNIVELMDSNTQLVQYVKACHQVYMKWSTRTKIVVLLWERMPFACGVGAKNGWYALCEY